MSKHNGYVGRVDESLKSLAFLIESGMEKAELVLAAQSITDKIQTMAENVAKMEASDLMPMLDSMKENFGPSVAQKFQQVVTAKIRDLTQALSSAKDEIGNEILRMEASVNGQPVSDMDMNDGAGDVGDDLSSDTDIADAPEAPEGDDLAPEGQDAPADDQGTDVPSDQDMSDIFKGADSNADEGPLGRVHKESVTYTDRQIVREFVKTLSEGNGAADAARIVAEGFNIDLDDVIDIVIESRK